jgi:hypothetical protein
MVSQTNELKNIELKYIALTIFWEKRYARRKNTAYTAISAATATILKVR